MNILDRFKLSLKKINESGFRYPITVVSLFMVASFISSDISNNNSNNHWIIISFVLNVFLTILAQTIYEKYFINKEIRWLLYGISGLISIVYYLFVKDKEIYSTDIITKTIVLIFIMVLLFLLIPSIKGNIDFNQSFMAFFKSIFLSYFYGLIVFLGTNLIIMAIDTLITDVSYRAYFHVASIVFVVFSPIYFLSLVPKHLTGEEDVISEDLQKSIECPKFLKVLVSYILIPILSVFTIILIIYLVSNIGSKFWSDNALEPMLVGYSIAVLIIYILASTFENKLVEVFRLIFPKVLIPIVLFQTIASIMKISDLGLTYGRYYVILFGIFGTIAGIIFSFISIKKNGIVIMILILMSLVSIAPVINAFNISRYSQVTTLRNVLDKNNMIIDEKIVANKNISDKDKEIIRKTIQYIYSMDYQKEIDYLENKDDYYNSFESLYGFPLYEDIYEENKKYVRKSLFNDASIDIEGYDILTKLSFSVGVNFDIPKEQYFKVREDELIFDLSSININKTISIKDDKTKETLISFKLGDLISEDEEGTNNQDIDAKEASKVYENDKIKINVIIQDIYLYLDDENGYGDYYLMILVKMK